MGVCFIAQSLMPRGLSQDSFFKYLSDGKNWIVICSSDSSVILRHLNPGAMGYLESTLRGYDWTAK